MNKSALTTQMCTKVCKQVLRDRQYLGWLLHLSISCTINTVCCSVTLNIYYLLLLMLMLVLAVVSLLCCFLFSRWSSRFSVYCFSSIFFSSPSVNSLPSFSFRFLSLSLLLCLPQAASAEGLFPVRVLPLSLVWLICSCFLCFVCIIVGFLIYNIKHIEEITVVI